MAITVSMQPSNLQKAIHLRIGYRQMQLDCIFFKEILLYLLMFSPITAI